MENTEVIRQDEEELEDCSGFRINQWETAKDPVLLWVLEYNQVG